MGGLNEAGCAPLFYGSCLEEEEDVSFSLGTSELCLLLFCFPPLEPELCFWSINLGARPLHYIFVRAFSWSRCCQLRVVQECVFETEPGPGAGADLGRAARGCPMN